jgi:hypothetical protein
MDLKDMECENAHWIKQAEDMIQLWAFWKTVMNRQIS